MVEYLRVSLLLAAACLFAQAPTIRANVPLVVIPISVTDQRGHFVYGLSSSDFLVFDNGQSRSIRVDDPDSVTASFRLVVLIQTSDISNSALLKIRKVGSVIQGAVIGANGQAAVVVFANQVKTSLDFTANGDAIDSAFRDLHSVETRKGRLLDAVARGLDMLGSKPPTRRSALLIIGESKDRGSETKLQDLLPAIQRSGVTIYSLAYSAYLTPLTTKASEYSPPEGGRGWILDSITETVHATKQDTCKMLTGATGGRQLKFETQSKLENDLIRLGGEMHSRYIISFTPPIGSKAGFHELAVQINGKPKLRVVARQGYWVGSGS